MSMMNANVAATTAMTANKPLDFELPEIGEAEFSNEELAEDIAAISFSFCGSILLHISYPAVLNSDCSASFLVLVSFSCSLCFFFM